MPKVPSCRSACGSKSSFRWLNIAEADAAYSCSIPATAIADKEIGNEIRAEAMPQQWNLQLRTIIPLGTAPNNICIESMNF
jgi:hypothetical protein